MGKYEMLLSLAIVASACLVGCSKPEGVCVLTLEQGPFGPSSSCFSKATEKSCEGEWHAYLDGDEKGNVPGQRTCKSLGFPRIAGKNQFGEAIDDPAGLP